VDFKAKGFLAFGIEIGYDIAINMAGVTQSSI
jgi:hypothetical protein